MWHRERPRGQSCTLRTDNQIPASSSRPKGTMVTYGGMAKQPVMVPVVSSGVFDSLRGMVPCAPLRMPRPLGSCTGASLSPACTFRASSLFPLANGVIMA